MSTAESWQAEARRLEETLADARHRVQHLEGRLRDAEVAKDLLKNTNTRLACELEDAENRLARLRSGGRG